MRSKLGKRRDDQVYDNFATTGDWMLNSAPDLETVINAGVCAQARHTDCLLMQLLTDRHCNLRWRRPTTFGNFMGVEAMVCYYYL